MATRTGRLAGSALLTVVALGLVAGGVLGARGVNTNRAHAEQAEFARDADAVGRAFDARTGEVARIFSTLMVVTPDLVNGGHLSAPANQALTGPDVGGIAVIRVNGPDGTPAAPEPVRGRLPASLDVSSIDSPVRRALEVARDSAEPQGALFAGQFITAIPHYRRTTAATSTQARRADLDAWVLGVVTPARLLTNLGSDANRTRLTLTVAGVRLAGTDADVGRNVVRRTMLLAGQPWQLAITRVRHGGFSAAAWGVLGMALLGAAGTLLVGRRAARSLSRSAVAAATLQRETRTIAALGPLLQQSLELAEVLPAVVVLLSDALDLERVGIQLVGEQGELVDVFALGGRAHADARELSASAGADDVAPGSDVALPMLRAGRTIGRLRFAPRQAMHPSRLDALRSAADLIAAATYNVEMFEREQATVRRLQELDRLKDAFLGTISHELRTPITAISGFVRLLGDHWQEISEPERLEFLARIERNSTSLGLLVDDLLDFALLESQAIAPQLGPVRISALVSKVVDQLAPLLRERTVHTELAAQAIAIGENNALERVLANLLTNAAKFSPPDSRIDVAVRHEGPDVTISVSDQGPGIAADDRVRVFTRFYRGDSEAALRTRGAGIGLAVVRELVEKLGGHIEIEDVAPHGTRMTVRLPAVPSSTPSTEHGMPAPRAHTPVPHRARSPQ